MNDNYLPYDFEQASSFIGNIVVSKNNPLSYFMITGVYVDEGVNIKIGNIDVNAETLLEKFTFKNGKPCGMLKPQNWYERTELK